VIIKSAIPVPETLSRNLLNSSRILVTTLVSDQL